MPDSELRTASDTIFAPATGTGKAAIAIIRISGPFAHGAVQQLAGRLPPFRELALRTLRDAEGEALDQGMVVIFPEGASYTGEAMAEIHCHGSQAVISDVIDQLSAMPAMRMAEPGEFTRRALMAGRMDLSEAEGLHALLEAETREQRRQALRIQSGAVSERSRKWSEILLQARALVEVAIDFSDEEVPDDTLAGALELVERALADMEAELSRALPAERLRSGFEVAIIGPPNVGKSSLLNAVAGREVALVTDIAGTTRDILEVRTDLGGLPVVFLDMAGLRKSADKVEALGIARAEARGEAADLRVFLSASDVGPLDWSMERQDGDIEIWSKCDLEPRSGMLNVSAATDAGISELLELIRERLMSRVAEMGILAIERQRLAVKAARDSLERCRTSLKADLPEIAGEELRFAMVALDRLIGRFGTEDVLDKIFAGFCLGK